MRKKTILTATVLGLAVLTGCVSVESTRAQLASGNPQQVKEANENIFQQATWNSRPESERIRYIELTKDYGVLFRIFRSTWTEDNIAKAVVKQIDFSADGCVARFLKDCRELKQGPYSNPLESGRESLKSVVIERILSTANEKSLIEAAKMTRESFFELEQPLLKKLAETTQSQEILFELLGGGRDETRKVPPLDIDNRPIALARLTDQKLLMELACVYAGAHIFRDDVHEKLLTKINDTTICDFIRSDKRLDRLLESSFLKKDMKVRIARISDANKLVAALSERKDDSGVKAVMERMSMSQIIASLETSNQSVKDMAATILFENGEESDIEIALPAIKDANTRDMVVAKFCIPDVQAGNAALARFFAVNPKKAYDIVFSWRYTGWDKRMDTISDMKLLEGLAAHAEYDGSNSGRTSSLDVAKDIKKAMLKNLTARVDALPKEKFDKLVTVMLAQSKKLADGGNTCVIGGYYTGMPLMGFIALAKTQEVKAEPKLWGMDADGKHVIVKAMSFNSGNLFKATGIERSAILLELPKKLGVDKFEFGVTKFKIERNTSDMQQISEYFGDYSGAYETSGGDIYYTSVTQSKNVVLRYDKGSGVLVIRSL